MPDISAIAQGLGALKALKDIGQTMIGLRDAAAFRERQIEFQQHIIDAQGAIAVVQQENTALTQKIGDLEKEVARLKAWDREKDEYELKEVGHGAFAYVRKTTAEPAEVPHWLCTNCYTKSQKSILSRAGTRAGVRGDECPWTCPACNAGILVHWSASPSKSGAPSI